MIRESLDESIASEEQLIVDVEAQLEAERVTLARFKELYERRYELHEEQAQLRRDRIQAERRISALEQRTAREERRSERLATSQDGSRRGRAVRIEVDDGAWAAVKREAVRRQLWLVWWIGDLVRVEVEALAAGEVSGRPSTRRRRSPGEADPTPQQRFLRIDVDDGHWSALRAAALDLGLTVGRYVGELTEAEAYGCGWRAAVSPVDG